MRERDDIPGDIEAAALSSYRGYLTEVTEESVSGGKIAHCTATGRNGEILSKIPMCRPYGFDSSPKANTELVFLETQAGLIVCCERYRRPTLTDGQVTLYDHSGAQILLKNTGSGRQVEIGAGGTMKDAARKTDKVAADTTMAAWLAAADTAFGLIQAANGLNSNPVIVAPTPVSDFGEISTGSATVGIED